MSSPVFEYMLHKKMWGLLVEHPWWDEKDAIRVLREEGVVKGPIAQNCFACHAQYNHTGQGIVVSDNMVHLENCRTELCPLDWGEYNSGPYYGCSADDCEAGIGLYSQWCDADTTEERVRFAKMIRDLPLRAGSGNIYKIN